MSHSLLNTTLALQSIPWWGLPWGLEFFHLVTSGEYVLLSWLSELLCNTALLYVLSLLIQIHWLNLGFSPFRLISPPGALTQSHIPRYVSCSITTTTPWIESVSLASAFVLHTGWLSDFPHSPLSIEACG